ncbi:MAG: serine/threonine protein kinase [Kofleriaceae bacterium]|nr:serine/threonine protein kinase [Kofleriaceae bacterium]
MAHSPARALDVGSVIAGTYTIEGLLGKGGMGAVFVASHARLPGKKVAIKILHPDVADAESIARFKREAEIASRLGHPNIVEVHDWNELPDGTPYIVYELLHGESLADRLRRGPLGHDEAMAILRQVGSALAAAHREGIVHRDLKPQNIFLVQADDGVSVKAKVLDFGISKIRGSTTVKTQDTAMLGTPQYMAPEQATGRHDEVDGRTDVFALGAVVYEMFAGVPAFQGTTIPEVVFKVVYEETAPLAERAPGVAPHVSAGVQRALAKKSTERWDDVGTFVEALTGSPLASGKRPLVPGAGAGTGSGPATGAGGAGTGAGAVRSTGQDAFAASVGSGDHASAMAMGVRASLAAAATVAGADSATRRRPARAAGGGQARRRALRRRRALHRRARQEPDAGDRDHHRPHAGGGRGHGGHRRWRQRGGQGAGGAWPTSAPAAADKTDGKTDGKTDVTVRTIEGGGASSGRGPGAATPRRRRAAATDAGVALASDAGAAAAVDATPRPRADAGAGASPRPRSDDADGGDPDERDPELKALLDEARAALARGDDDGALRLAKKITTRFPKAQAAWAVRATANCGLADQELARADFRRIRRPALVRAVRKACKQHGIEL